MPDGQFAKSPCQHCGGRIAFPADGIGRTIACPHCGQATLLQVASPLRNRPMVLALAVGLAMVALAGGGLLAHKMGLLPGGKPAQPSVIPDPPPADLQRVQELAFWEIDLEQKEGSRLIYVLARVLNESPLRRYGVRVEFELRNEVGEPVAAATDYIATLDPGEHTRVKALVVSSQAHSAVVRGITEQ